MKELMAAITAAIHATPAKCITCASEGLCNVSAARRLRLPLRLVEDY